MVIRDWRSSRDQDLLETEAKRLAAPYVAHQPVELGRTYRADDLEHHQTYRWDELADILAASEVAVCLALGRTEHEDAGLISRAFVVLWSRSAEEQYRTLLVPGVLLALAKYEPNQLLCMIEKLSPEQRIEVLLKPQVVYELTKDGRPAKRILKLIGYMPTEERTVLFCEGYVFHQLWNCIPIGRRKNLVSMFRTLSRQQQSRIRDVLGEENLPDFEDVVDDRTMWLYCLAALVLAFIITGNPVTGFAGLAGGWLGTLVVAFISFPFVPEMKQSETLNRFVNGCFLVASIIGGALGAHGAGELTSAWISGWPWVTAKSFWIGGAVVPVLVAVGIGKAGYKW